MKTIKTIVVTDGQGIAHIVQAEYRPNCYDVMTFHCFLSFDGKTALSHPKQITPTLVKWATAGFNK